MILTGDIGGTKTILIFFQAEGGRLRPIIFQEIRQKAEGRSQKGRGFNLFVPFVARGYSRLCPCS
ncbi:hypothetical protein SAMD00079811_76460 (plasmid) [Scytonema sp. HK-05]|uniref:hypothetical protein n=1 Tax=Scytonema sp. HK-05 TaxID=1137095 RepID=UPI0009658B7C|nr:hypothetical protein NIES2130_30135 [Scytonema sp. HK-05]BAY50017.1 hypothetical protein SAMD00079811_76460 [Scytonema sp. HK-05]